MSYRNNSSKKKGTASIARKLELLMLWLQPRVDALPKTSTFDSIARSAVENLLDAEILFSRAYRANYRKQPEVARSLTLSMADCMDGLHVAMRQLSQMRYRSTPVLSERNYGQFLVAMNEISSETGYWIAALDKALND